MKKYLYAILIVIAICIVGNSTMLGTIAIMVGIVAIGCFGLLDLAVFCIGRWEKKHGPTREDYAFLDGYNELLKAAGVSEEERTKSLKKSAKERGIKL